MISFEFCLPMHKLKIGALSIVNTAALFRWFFSLAFFKAVSHQAYLQALSNSFG